MEGPIEHGGASISLRLCHAEERLATIRSDSLPGEQWPHAERHEERGAGRRAHETLLKRRLMHVAARSTSLGLNFQEQTNYDNLTNESGPITAFALRCTDRSDLLEYSSLYLSLAGRRSASAWVRCDTDFVPAAINVHTHPPDPRMRV
jgi:hypothetical protein